MQFPNLRARGTYSNRRALKDKNYQVYKFYKSLQCLQENNSQEISRQWTTWRHIP
jgi:hypothetical protein